MATSTDRSVSEKRRQILEAAVRVFARDGYHTSRVADVAAEAGVAHGLVYHYFASKSALLEAVFTETWEGLLEAIGRVEQSGGPRASSCARSPRSCCARGGTIPT